MPLVDSDKWKATFLSINSLRFHPANPRLPGSDVTKSERQIILELCENEQVDAIAKSISEKGYLRNERLIVYREDGANYVYEGNRRLCALKVLLKPDLAPAGKRRYFEKLKEKASIPPKIAVEVVPSRFDAEVVMYSKHAGDKYMIKWTPLQQATFVAARLSEGDTIDGICQAHGIERQAVVRSRSLVDLYRLCQFASLSPSAKAMVTDPSKFPTSVLFERLIEPRKVGLTLGFDVTENGLMSPPEGICLPLLARILEDIASGCIDTRKLNSLDEQIAYASKLGVKGADGPKVPSNSIKGNANPPQIPGIKPGQSAPPNSKKADPAKQSSKPATAARNLFPDDLVCELNSQKLIALVGEGKGLVIAHAPNACGVFLRCVLDIALQEALAARGAACIKAIEKKHPNQRGLPTKKHDLKTSHLLQDAREANDFDIGLDGHEKRYVDSLVKNGPLSYDSLNLIIHNPHWNATEQTVTQLRDAVLPIIRKALQMP